jgi:hypothetical protein
MIDIKFQCGGASLPNGDRNDEMIAAGTTAAIAIDAQYERGRHLLASSLLLGGLLLLICP